MQAVIFTRNIGIQIFLAAVICVYLMCNPLILPIFKILTSMFPCSMYGASFNQFMLPFPSLLNLQDTLCTFRLNKEHLKSMMLTFYEENETIQAPTHMRFL